MLVDTHAHLFWESYSKDLDVVLKRSLDAGVTTIVNVGTDVKTSREALRQVFDSEVAQTRGAEELIVAERSSDFVENPRLDRDRSLTLYSSIGIHPHEAVKYFSSKQEAVSNKLAEDINKLEEIYHSKNPSTHSVRTQGRPESSRRTTHSARSGPRIIAVGECGLDFMFEGNPDWLAPRSFSEVGNIIEKVKDLQRQLLKAQVNLAKKLNLPLLIHCRTDSAWEEIWEFIKDWRGILHCYSGNEQTSKLATTSDFLISFPGTITYPKNEYLRQLASKLPLEKFVFETDSPFLPPQSKRGTRNEPSSVREIAELVANLRGTSIEEISDRTTQNFKKLFNLS